MEQLMWKVIEESKAGKKYCTSKTQYNNLVKILTGYDKETIKGIYEAWQKKKNELVSKNPEFEKLHKEDGGIVNAGDDGFYMDFANWLVAQGEELNKQFKENGHTAVIDYIRQHKVTRKNYLFECMVYAFHPYV